MTSKPKKGYRYVVTAVEGTMAERMKHGDQATGEAPARAPAVPSALTARAARADSSQQSSPMTELARTVNTATFGIPLNPGPAKQLARAYLELVEQLDAVRELVATDERSAVIAKERIREVLGV